MLLLERPPVTELIPTSDNQDTCVYHDSTIICGKIKEVDYLNRVESKMITEPFYGDIDLFGF
jgi:hypothetical protein